MVLSFLVDYSTCRIRKKSQINESLTQLFLLIYCGAPGKLFRYFELAQLTGGGLLRWGDDVSSPLAGFLETKKCSFLMISPKLHDISPISGFF
jgi:hypothetical protein